MNRLFSLSILILAVFIGCSGGKEMSKPPMTLKEKFEQPETLEEMPKPILTLDELLSGSSLPAVYTAVYTAADTSELDGGETFKAYLEALVSSATENSSEELAAELAVLQEIKKLPAENLNMASVLLRNYVVRRYGDAIVKDLQTMVGFRTYAEEGRENWMAPEFVRQRDWLESRADELGLGFKTYDGRVDEFSLTGPEAVLAILTHGDVQGVEGQEWSSSPWAGEIVDGKIIGRGTQDDKGAVVMTYYVLKALKDTGWEFNHTLKLIIANAEESSWEEISYYKERAPAHEYTIGIDGEYPVTHAQKGYGLLTLSSNKISKSSKKGEWTVLSMSGGFGGSIIPEKGEAIVAGVTNSLNRLTKLARAWENKHPPARFTLGPEKGNVKLIAHGASGHSASPESGHNALGDLTAFLASLDLTPNSWGVLTMHLGKYIGSETDGASWGIAHTDSVMGSMTTNLAIINVTDGNPTAIVNIRAPRGITSKQVKAAVNKRIKKTNRKYGSTLSLSMRLGDYHFVPTDGKFVKTLLEVWEEVTGEPGEPIAIGGGTQARLFPNGVDFGLSTDDKHYRGHGADEYMKPEELFMAAELTISAILRLTTSE
ncbi:MAG: Sapep family Mn(2+)-dependent dipeptidase [Candidatus Marinimicrobia bacterium]|nr:Sapep family Mn(2+)-dependent dipeptidase [Candidatus Neomarinimicrobiota bacterium]